jgi:hypothetical protein
MNTNPAILTTGHPMVHPNRSDFHRRADLARRSRGYRHNRPVRRRRTDLYLCRRVRTGGTCSDHIGDCGPSQRRALHRRDDGDLARTATGDQSESAFGNRRSPPCGDRRPPSVVLVAVVMTAGIATGSIATIVASDAGFTDSASSCLRHDHPATPVEASGSPGHGQTAPTPDLELPGQDLTSGL